MRIGYQGEKGAYSEIAARKYFLGNIETIGFKDLEKVFDAVTKKKIDFGIVPIENSQVGSIYKTYDLLLKKSLFIYGEYYMGITHCLLGNKGTSLKKIKKVFSHPQALGQCEKFLAENNYQEYATYDTAGSAKIIGKNDDEAIIASEDAAKIYGLKVLKKSIETNKYNTTRFIIISMTENNIRENCKTSLVFETKHIPAALYKCLGGFATNGINLTKIESRPIKGEQWKYMFYLDFEGHKDDVNIKFALEELKSMTLFLKLLGSYPKGK